MLSFHIKFVQIDRRMDNSKTIYQRSFDGGRIKVVKAFTEQQKEEIVNFLMLLIYQTRSHNGSIVIEIAQNIHPTIETHRNRGHQSLMLVSERISTYRVITDRGHLSLWSRQIAMESWTQSWYSCQIVCDRVYPGHRSYPQKLTSHDQIASKRNIYYVVCKCFLFIGHCNIGEKK